jgi:tripartite ATP-independent transporter DctM subunit
MSAWGFAAWLLLVGSTVLLFLGLPVAFSFLVVNIVGAWLWLGGEPGFVQLARNSVSSVMSFSLTPIPLFVLMGEILFHTGLAVKVIDGIERLIAQVPGRLAVVAVVAGTVFSAISGSTIATTAMLGSLMVPVMLARGYHPTLATGPVMAIGAVDMLIPPSALTVLLGSLSGISISKLLIGGVMPGLVLAVAFVAWIIVRVRITPSLAPNVELVRHEGFSRFKPFLLYVLPLVSIFGVVVGAMAAGWGTPTESAAVGALATIVLALVYRSLSWKILIASAKGTVAISAMILFIIVGATTFAQILSFSGASNGLAQAITGSGLAPWAVVVAMMAMLIFLGIFVDQVSMMMITLPIFMPVVQALGIDPVWFGVMYLICMQLGLLLPPHGLLLMTMRGVAPPEVRMGHIFAAVVPYVSMSLLLLAAVFAWPAIATWLPKQIG